MFLKDLLNFSKGHLKENLQIFTREGFLRKNIVAVF